MPYHHQILTFDALGSALLYDILALRAQVFVVEQQSPYLDLDGMDQHALHLCQFANDKIIGYARLFPPGVKFDEASVGRLVIAPEFRGMGLGKELLQLSMQAVHANFANAPIRIEAQNHLQKFYESLGFCRGF